MVLQKRENQWPFDDNIDMRIPENQDLLREHLRSGEQWEIPEEVLLIASDSNISPRRPPWWSPRRENVPKEVFENLRSLGSSLRGSLADDVQTRTVSVLERVGTGQGWPSSGEG
jgi:hypothetical protein